MSHVISVLELLAKMKIALTKKKKEQRYAYLTKTYFRVYTLVRTGKKNRTPKIFLKCVTIFIILISTKIILTKSKIIKKCVNCTILHQNLEGTFLKQYS